LGDLEGDLAIETGIVGPINSAICARAETATNLEPPEMLGQRIRRRCVWF
jgi:hypothetical protein